MFEKQALIRISYDQGLAFGLFIAAVSIGIVYGATIEWALTQETISDLFLGITAISAAALSIRAIRHQIQSNHDIELERTKRKLRSKTALLPNALHDLYSESLRISKQLWDPIPGFQANWEIMSAAFRIVEPCIEYSDSESASTMSKIVARYQILRARSEKVLLSPELTKDAPNTIKVNDVLVYRCDKLIEWIEFMKLVESGFSYARKEVSTFSMPDLSELDFEHILRFHIDNVADTRVLWKDFQGHAKL